MEQRWIILFIVMMVMVTFVHPQDDFSDIVDQCQLESEQFARTEDKYAETHKIDPSKPTLEPQPNKVLQPVVYRKEILQRPFECITEKTDPNSFPALVANPKYKELVLQCKSNQSTPLCDPVYPYRSFDGTCNNLKFPKYGSVLNCLRRRMEQNYHGAAGFRQSVCGKPLPDSRLLSRKIFRDFNRPAQNVTHMASFFGQCVAHDMTDVAVTSINGKDINCNSCFKTGLHPQCAPISIKTSDTFYSKYKVKCFNFRRTAMCDTCSVGKRTQMNQQTSYLDLSLIYGVSEDAANIMRTKDGSGKLHVYNNGSNGDLLPRECPDISKCPDAVREEREYYFTSGDRRVNMHTVITSLHTIFHLEHNRLAEELKSMNTNWEEEKIFQEARKINIAQYQSIIYQEHLPVILGPELMSRYDLYVNSDQKRTAYDTFVDATLFAEFNTAAYRLHSTVNGVVTNPDGDEGKTLFRNISVNPMLLYQNKMSSLMEGICLHAGQKYDRYMTKELTNFLYKRPSGNYGLDLAAINIQRGRDNGLPTYTEMVSHLSKGSINIQSFGDLKFYMDKTNIKILRKSYCDVKDIDLWVGFNNERVHKDSVSGPTASQLIALQFQNLKFGDRFYFEHLGNFNDNQLETLKTVTLSSLLCRNTKIERMQLHAHRFPSETNPIKLCTDIPKINLAFWKE